MDVYPSGGIYRFFGYTFWKRFGMRAKFLIVIMLAFAMFALLPSSQAKHGRNAKKGEKVTFATYPASEIYLTYDTKEQKNKYVIWLYASFAAGDDNTPSKFYGQFRVWDWDRQDWSNNYTQKNNFFSCNPAAEWNYTYYIWSGTQLYNDIALQGSVYVQARMIDWYEDEYAADTEWLYLPGTGCDSTKHGVPAAAQLRQDRLVDPKNKFSAWSFMGLPSRFDDLPRDEPKPQRRGEFAGPQQPSLKRPKE